MSHVVVHGLHNDWTDWINPLAYVGASGYADGTDDEWSNGLNSIFAQGLKYQRDGAGTSGNKAPLTDYLVSDMPATRTHSAAPTYDSEITVDRFGQPTSTIDAYGNQTRIFRDANGRITRLVEPVNEDRISRAPIRKHRRI